MALVPRRANLDDRPAVHAAAPRRIEDLVTTLRAAMQGDGAERVQWTRSGDVAEPGIRNMILGVVPTVFAPQTDTLGAELRVVLHVHGLRSPNTEAEVEEISDWIRANAVPAPEATAAFLRENPIMRRYGDATRPNIEIFDLDGYRFMLVTERAGAFPNYGSYVYGFVPRPAPAPAIAPQAQPQEAPPAEREPIAVEVAAPQPSVAAVAEAPVDKTPRAAFRSWQDGATRRYEAAIWRGDKAEAAVVRGVFGTEDVKGRPDSGTREDALRIARDANGTAEAPNPNTIPGAALDKLIRKASSLEIIEVSPEVFKSRPRMRDVFGPLLEAGIEDPMRDLPERLRASCLRLPEEPGKAILALWSDGGRGAAIVTVDVERAGVTAQQIRRERLEELLRIRTTRDGFESTSPAGLRPDALQELLQQGEVAGLVPDEGLWRKLQPEGLARVIERLAAPKVAAQAEPDPGQAAQIEAFATAISGDDAGRREAILQSFARVADSDALMARLRQEVDAGVRGLVLVRPKRDGETQAFSAFLWREGNDRMALLEGEHGVAPDGVPTDEPADRLTAMLEQRLGARFAVAQSVELSSRAAEKLYNQARRSNVFASLPALPAVGRYDVVRACLAALASTRAPAPKPQLDPRDVERLEIIVLRKEGGEGEQLQREVWLAAPGSEADGTPGFAFRGKVSGTRVTAWEQVGYGPMLTTIFEECARAGGDGDISFVETAPELNYRELLSSAIGPEAARNYRESFAAAAARGSATFRARHAEARILARTTALRLLVPEGTRDSMGIGERIKKVQRPGDLSNLVAAWRTAGARATLLRAPSENGKPEAWFGAIWRDEGNEDAVVVELESTRIATPTMRRMAKPEMGRRIRSLLRSRYDLCGAQPLPPSALLSRLLSASAVSGLTPGGQNASLTRDHEALVAAAGSLFVTTPQDWLPNRPTRSMPAAKGLPGAGTDVLPFFRAGQGAGLIAFDIMGAQQAGRPPGRSDMFLYVSPAEGREGSVLQLSSENDTFTGACSWERISWEAFEGLLRHRLAPSNQKIFHSNTYRLTALGDQLRKHLGEAIGAEIVDAMGQGDIRRLYNDGSNLCQRVREEVKAQEVARAAGILGLDANNDHFGLSRRLQENHETALGVAQWAKACQDEGWKSISLIKPAEGTRDARFYMAIWREVDGAPAGRAVVCDGSVGIDPPGKLQVVEVDALMDAITRRQNTGYVDGPHPGLACLNRIYHSAQKDVGLPRLPDEVSTYAAQAVAAAVLTRDIQTALRRANAPKPADEMTRAQARREAEEVLAAVQKAKEEAAVESARNIGSNALQRLREFGLKVTQGPTGMLLKGILADGRDVEVRGRAGVVFNRSPDWVVTIRQNGRAAHETKTSVDDIVALLSVEPEDAPDAPAPG